MITAGPFLTITGNWVKTVKGGGERLYRYLAEDATNVWVMEVGTVKQDAAIVHKPLKTKGYRKQWRKQEISVWLKANRLRHIEERCIPNEILDARLPPGMSDELDMKRSLVDFVKDEFGDSYVLTEKGYREAVKLASSTFDVAPQTAAGWLEYDLFYGHHVNSNVPHNWNKGGRGLPRRALRSADGKLVPILGRPTDAEVIDPDTKLKRQRCPPRRYANWCEFVTREAWNSDDRIKVILERYKLLQVGFNRDVQGIVRAFPANRKLPSDNYLTQIARPILRRVREERRIARSNQPGHRRVLSGGSGNQLAYGDLSVYDIDATPVDNHILYGREEIYINGCGKPTALLAVDRGSDAIVGWYLTFGFENGDCYRRCVFSAYTPKERELARWGVLHLLPGMVYGAASQIFIDRGPGISENMQMAFVERLRNDLLMARPGDPAGKGHGEQVMLMIQADLSHVLGSTHKTGDKEVDRQKLKVAKKVAVELEVYMVAFLSAIARRNLELDARHLLTSDMIKDELKPVPVEIFNYNKGLRDGDFDWDWSEEKIYRNLCWIPPSKAPDGFVSYDGRQYSSAMLRAQARVFQQVNPGKTLVVKLFDVPNAPLTLLWEDAGCNLQVLEAESKTQATYEDTFKWHHDFVSKLKNKRLREARARNASTTRQATNSSGSVSETKQIKLDAVESRGEAAGVATSSRSARKAAKEHLDRQDSKHLFAALGVPQGDEGVQTAVSGSANEHDSGNDGGQDFFTDF
ncbi:hypothetical protein AWB76_07234 [Caballeronia temeraria]|uniref:Integrase catalytic subunit n=1 Tax=Caballeronia temeraria TaxID=1777137 RepID=A0A158DN62_9BURK|nr:hypothetical protein [Caballeronia temeraria]SAK96052.1 hypothetical protein AWB76_07234 [Caballeronia temeraria]